MINCSSCNRDIDEINSEVELEYDADLYLSGWYIQNNCNDCLNAICENMQ